MGSTVGWLTLRIDGERIMDINIRVSSTEWVRVLRYLFFIEADTIGKNNLLSIMEQFDNTDEDIWYGVFPDYAFFFQEPSSEEYEPRGNKRVLEVEMEYIGTTGKYKRYREYTISSITNDWGI